MQKFNKVLASLALFSFLALGVLVTTHPARAAFDTTYIDGITASGNQMMQDTGTAGFHIMGLVIPTYMGIGITFGIVATIVALVMYKLGAGGKIFGGKRRR